VWFKDFEVMIHAGGYLYPCLFIQPAQMGSQAMALVLAGTAFLILFFTSASEHLFHEALVYSRLFTER
jgi:hypothetical protein